MTAQPGWHPDPAPPVPGQPAQLRYWDGRQWTEHTAPHPQAAAAYGRPMPVTPDGVPLASWGQRVGAALIDALILVPIGAIVDIPFYGTIIDKYRHYFDQIQQANDSGAAPPSSTSLQTDLFPTLVLMSLVGVVVSLVWTVAWLRTKQATPGKLALGLRIRRRDVAGPLPYGTILRRWVAQTVIPLFGIIPFVGLLTGLYSLLDVLWPLWDDKRQALHDKFAATNVIQVEKH